MSLLNFFKNEEKKTDASITYNTVLNTLKNTSEANDFDIDSFIQTENIDLRQHQSIYQKKEPNTTTINNILTDLQDKKEITQEDGRRLVNTFITFTETLPELQSNVDDSVERLKASQKCIEDNMNMIQKSSLLE